MTQEELAIAVDATQGAISQIYTGMTRRSRLLPAIATALAVNLDWLVGTSDQKIDMFDADGKDISEDDLALIRAGRSQKRLSNPAQLETPQTIITVANSNEASVPPAAEEDEDDEIVEVKEIDLRFGMGGGGYLEVPVKKKPRKFTRGWLRLFTNAPHTRIFIAQGIGDSMAPTIMNADMVIIDTSENEVQFGDQIWAAAYGQTGVIKRLRPLPDGGVKILSDNPLVEAETAYDGELHVLGKVVAVIRRMAG
ncbi:XRE family transcriptional regulator [Novosphingobium sp. ERN07]|uniref:XRE family transcriptional regulator n=1 Tax=Novosphingobium sp. ERN07 TaxID=2726187 RepID=UPI0019825421|nr:S24 family peptidase [Novosphingobium sp. ERN07]